MYDELVKALRHCAFWDCADCNYRPACADLTWEAADAIEELMRRCEQFQYMPLPSWIPVTERLPEIGTYIIAGRMKYDYEKTSTHFEDVAYFGPRWDDVDYSWQTFNDWCEGQQEFEITHWMPLPEPPKEET